MIIEPAKTLDKRLFIIGGDGEAALFLVEEVFDPTLGRLNNGHSSSQGVE